jgi:hypothetical protein
MAIARRPFALQDHGSRDIYAAEFWRTSSLSAIAFPRGCNRSHCDRVSGASSPGRDAAPSSECVASAARHFQFVSGISHVPCL